MRYKIRELIGELEDLFTQSSPSKGDKKPAQENQKEQETKVDTPMVGEQEVSGSRLENECGILSVIPDVQAGSPIASFFGNAISPGQCKEANGHIAFDNPYSRSSAPIPQDNSFSESLANWFGGLESAFNKNGGQTSNPEQFNFTTTDANGNNTQVSQNGDQTIVDGKNQDGVGVNITDNQTEVQGQVGDAQIQENKQNKHSTYESQNFHIAVEGNVKKVQDQQTGDNFQWNSGDQQGQMTNKNGTTIIMSMSSTGNASNITQQLGNGAEVTQTTGQASAVAEQQASSGQASAQPHIIADSKGNYAVVQKSDGQTVQITTQKAQDTTVVQVGGDTVKVHNHQVEALVQEGAQKVWKLLKGHHKDRNLEVDANGDVKVGNQAVVSGNGQVTAANGTTINTATGSMKTNSSTGEVTGTNSNGQTTVSHKGVGAITDNGSGFVNQDPSTQNIFQSWNPGQHSMQVMGGKNGSGVAVDTSQGGNLTVTESNGQKTTMSPDGSLTSVDANGNTLLSIGKDGSVTLFNGLVIGADGSLTKDGSGAGFDSGGSASDALSQAMGIVANAMSAGDSATQTSALMEAASILNNYASLYSATNHLDVATMLSGKAQQVESLIGAAAKQDGNPTQAPKALPNPNAA